MKETLAELNQDRWGGASTPGADAESCKADSDCVKGQFCDDGTCRTAPGSDSDEAIDLDEGKAGGAKDKGGKGASCRGDADCSSTLVCTDGTCREPK